MTPTEGTAPVQRRRTDGPRPLHALTATDPLPTWVWHEPTMAGALAERDMATVYRLLQVHGLSQRSIAARTGQSQSEISEVMSGRRIVSYDVLVRIADGLAVSRGYLGLAYDGPDRRYASAGGGPVHICEHCTGVPAADCPIWS